MNRPLRFVTSMRGFTLLELLVCIFIFSIISAIVLADYPEAEMRIQMASINQKVSLLYREAQLRGSAIDAKTMSGSAVGGYGVYISLTTPNQIVMFNDLVNGIISPNGLPIGDGLYSTSTPDETNTTIIIPQHFSVAKLCIWASNAFSCNTSNTPQISSLTVTFIRPNPMPQIYINNDSSTSYSAACVQLQSIEAPLAGHVKNIQIFNSGLIKNSIGPC